MTALDGWVPSERQRRRESVRRARDRRRAAVAAVSTVVVLGLLVVAVLAAPGWERVQQTYLSLDVAREAFPLLLRAFVLNIVLFCVAEVLILVVATLVAVVRVVPSPALAPLKILAVVYTDVFRGTPTILVVFLVGFGLPALGLQGVPTNLFVLALIALTLSYSAYVSEVIRAGIESVHPTQWASARALGMSYRSALRHVVLPQALRRVTPPLLNDFVGLQKESALASLIGLAEVLRRAQEISSRDFNFTPYVVASVLFVLATIPLARLTDWLSLRAARRQAGAS